jgi:hypothetical protein
MGLISGETGNGGHGITPCEREISDNLWICGGGIGFRRRLLNVGEIIPISDKTAEIHCFVNIFSLHFAKEVRFFTNITTYQACRFSVLTNKN